MKYKIMDKTNIKFEDIPAKSISYKAIEKRLTGYINSLKSASTFKEGIKIIHQCERFSNNLQNNVTVIQIRYSLNTNDKKIARLNNQVDEVLPLVSGLFNEWNKTLLNVPFRDELEAKYSPYYFKMIENQLKSFDEKIIPELIEINKLTSKYSLVLGSAQIEFEGNVYNLPQMGKFTTSKEQKVRHDASVAVDSWFGQHEKEIGDIYSQLVLLRDQMAKKLGYKNFIELGYLLLGRTDYDADKVANYRKQIAEEVVPVCQKLYRAQAKRIGIPFNKMANYDFNLSFLSGNAIPQGNCEQLVQYATEMYEEMSKESGEFFHFMRDHHLLDLEARAGKQPGGYMTYLPVQGFPFIFANFNGTSGDVDVLTHEVGHAFQGYLSRNIKPSEFHMPTLEACEIHSMSMEFFAWPWMDKFFKENADKYRYDHLANAIEFLPYGITIDEFQHWVYENPTATHEERCSKFKEIESRYTPHKNYVDQPTYAHGGFWMKQSHVFGSPFYYIDYTLAQVCAFQFLDEMHKNQPKAWAKYVHLCKLGGKYPFVTLLKKAHLRNPFEDGNVRKVIRPCVKILNNIDISKY